MNKTEEQLRKKSPINIKSILNKKNLSMGFIVSSLVCLDLLLIYNLDAKCFMRKFNFLDVKLTIR